MSSLTTSAETLAAIITVASVALGFLGLLARKTWKGLKRWSRFLDDYEGTPARPGVDAHPGVMERLKNQDDVLAVVVDAQSTQSDVLAEVQTQLAAVVDEMPKNGLPLAHKIDALWAKFIADGGAVRVGPTVVIHNEGGSA